MKNWDYQIFITKEPRNQFASPFLKCAPIPATEEAAY